VLPPLRRIAERGDLYQVLLALKQNRRKRSELGELFVEGVESIKQGLGAPRFSPSRLVFADYDRLSDWGKGLAAEGGFSELVELGGGLYEELADRAEPSEIMATFRFERLELSSVRLPERPLVVVFDRPSDLGNLGSLIRSANAFGADLFITHGHCVDFFDPKVIRSSLGAVFRTPLVHVEPFDELASFLLDLKEERGLAVLGTDSTGDLVLGKDPVEAPAAVVLGNEAKGMSVRLKGLVDRTYRIPMVGDVNSLNVACAGSIFLWSAAAARSSGT